MNTEETIETTHHTAKTSRTTKALRAGTTLAVAAGVSVLSMNGALAIDTSPEAIPGSEGMLRIVRWVVWGAGVLMLMFFVFGLVRAARSKNGHGEDRIEAPMWPAVGGGLLTGVGSIWSILTGI